MFRQTVIITALIALAGCGSSPPPPKVSVDQWLSNTMESMRQDEVRRQGQTIADLQAQIVQLKTQNQRAANDGGCDALCVRRMQLESDRRMYEIAMAKPCTYSYHGC